MNVANKVAVITGAGSGIGRATALEFARAGARIAVCDIDHARLASLANEVNDAGGALLMSREVDVSNRAEMAGFADEVHGLVPAVDIVVNNAGVGLGGNFLETSLDDWEWVVGVNLRGVVHGCHFFVPNMVNRGTGGQVINVSSILGIYPAPQLTAYVASKFAVLGFSQSLRAELAPHRIGVTAICPGLIATAIIDDARLTGALGTRRAKVMARFRKVGAPPATVARAIVDAVDKNPAVRTVGRDAWAIRALTVLAPRVTTRLGTAFTQRFGAGE